MPDELVVESRFCGLEGMGQGGYSAGLLAEALDRQVLVRFHSPVPLDLPLRIDTSNATSRLLHHGNLILSAEQTGEHDEPPPSVDLETATAGREWAESRFLEPARTCFSCGSRPDSLRIHAGQVDSNLFATPYVPPDWTAAGDGDVRLPYVWAPLDCAAGWHVALDETEPRLAVTGWLTVDQLLPLQPENTYIVVTSAHEEWNGRKRQATSAIYDSGGVLHARSASLWISV